MSFNLNRLRGGEWLVATGAAALSVCLFFLKWFEVKVPKLFSAFVSVAGYSNSFTGWHSLTNTRWVLLAAILLALALVVLAACDRLPRPALPLGVAALGALATILVFYRAIVELPGGNAVHAKLGAYLGLIACAALTCGGLMAAAQEGARNGEAIDREEAALAP